MTDATPVYDRLEDLLTHPELLAPPTAAIPRLAWAGRLTLFVGAEKLGKSTLAGQAVAAAAMGSPFLGDPVRRARSLWFLLDEALTDLVRRLAGYGATGGVAICRVRPSVAEFGLLLLETSASVVVIDTLVEFTAGAVEDPYRAADWQGPLAELREIAQRTGTAIVLLHHTTRDGKRYADSRQIGAGVDQIITMQQVEGDPTLRAMESRGRVTFDRFRLRFVGGAYQLDAGELPLAMRIYRAVEADPGIGSRALVERVGGKTRDVYAALASLIRQGVIVDGGDGKGGRGQGAGHRYRVQLPFSEAGPGRPENGGCAKGEER